jgi:hypothetical protein
VYDVVLLTLAEGAGDACCGSDACDSHAKADTLRAPVRACVDALVAAGARVETVTAHADKDIDEVLARFDGPARPDGLTWPDSDSKTRLVVAAATDGQLRHVIRRLVRRYAPAPSRRPEDLAGNRTVPDLPAVAVLPMGPASHDLVGQLGLPRDPAAVAAAVLDGPVKRLDLLRNDAGSVTLDGVLIGGVNASGSASTFLARVEVDDAVLADGTEPVLMSVVANASRYATVDGLPLVLAPDMSDGVLDVAVAVPRASRSLFRRPRVEIEVRRAHGRAVAITPRTEVPFVDDGAEGTLSRKRSWWMERAAWAVYVP